MRKLGEREAYITDYCALLGGKQDNLTGGTLPTDAAGVVFWEKVGNAEAAVSNAIKLATLKAKGLFVRSILILR